MVKRKKCVVLFLLLAMLLCSCASQPASPEELMTFPGTRWTMEPEELITALKLEEGAYTSSVTEDAHILAVEGMEVFGATATVGFQFTVPQDGTPGGLICVRVLYEDTADMEAVFTQMTKAYGECAPIDADRDEDYRTHVRIWESDLREYEGLTEQELESLTASLQELTGTEPDESNSLYTSPLVHVFWSDDAGYIFTGSPDLWQGPEKGLMFSCGLASIQEQCAELTE